jgi:hypothetical protein
MTVVGTTGIPLVLPCQLLKIAGPLTSINKSCCFTTSDPLGSTDRLADRLHTDVYWHDIMA